MADAITVSTTSTRIVHTFQVDFKGNIVLLEKLIYVLQV